VENHRRFAYPFRLVTENAHALPSHIGQSVERVQLAAMDTILCHRTFKQKAAPSVREAVIEYAEQTVEDRGVGNGYADAGGEV
jgi:hypothetical protein